MFDMAEASGLLGVLAGALVAFLFFFIIIGLVLYILHGIGLMGIAKKLNVRHGWMAWIPVLNFYLLGKVAFNNVLVQIGLPALLILSGSYETTVNGETAAKGSILPSPLNDIAWYVFIIMVFISLFMIYKKMSKKAVIMIIFTILTFGLLGPIFLFAIRKNNMETNDIAPVQPSQPEPIPQVPSQPMPQPIEPNVQPIPQVQNTYIETPKENNQQQNNQL